MDSAKVSNRFSHFVHIRCVILSSRKFFHKMLWESVFLVVVGKCIEVTISSRLPCSVISGD